MALSAAMPITIDTKTAHLVRNHRDITAIYTWIDHGEGDAPERALLLALNTRPGSPWYIVCESAAWTWNDNDPSNIPAVVRKSRAACEQLGLEPTGTNALRIATIVVEGIPDLIRMPSKPEGEKRGIRVGEIAMTENGRVIRSEDILVGGEQGVTYG